MGNGTTINEHGQCVICKTPSSVSHRDFICEDCGEPNKAKIHCKLCGLKTLVSIQEFEESAEKQRLKALGLKFPEDPLGLIIFYDNCGCQPQLPKGKIWLYRISRERKTNQM